MGFHSFYIILILTRQKCLVMNLYKSTSGCVHVCGNGIDKSSGVKDCPQNTEPCL